MDQIQTQTPETELELARPVSERAVYPRDARMVEIEIDCDVMAQAIDGGLIVTQGRGRYRVLAKDLPKIEALVRTPDQVEKYKICKEQFERNLKHRIDTDELVVEFQRRGGGDDAAGYELAKRIREIKSGYGESPEAQLQKLFPDVYPSGFAPFNSVRVLARDLVNPSDQERITAAKERAELERAARTEEGAASASVVASAVADALKPVVDLILQQMQQQPPKKGG